MRYALVQYPAKERTLIGFIKTQIVSHGTQDVQVWDMRTLTKRNTLDTHNPVTFLRYDPHKIIVYALCRLS